MIGIFRSPQLANKNKFSYATAQQYCQLVKRSIDKANSQSKHSPFASHQVKIPPRPLLSTDKQPSLHKLRQRIRSRSNSNRQSQQKSRSLSKCQITNLNLNTQSQNSQEIKYFDRKISSYEQQHLLGSLYRENSQLREVICQTEGKVQKMKAKIEEQRNSQNIQREMYQQQLKKLRQTLQLQLKGRGKSSKSQEQSIIGESMNSYLSQRRI